MSLPPSLSTEPSHENWAALCDWLNAQPADAVEAQLHALQHALAPWPADLLSSPEGWIDALLAGQHVPALSLIRALDASGKKLGLRGLKALLDAPALPDLERLDLAATKLNLSALRHLVAHPRLARLRALRLQANPVRAGWLHALRDAPWLATLEELGLARCGLGDDEAAALAGLPLPALRHLDISDMLGRGSKISDVGGCALAGAPLLAGLESLDIGEQNIGDRSILALTTLTLPRLRRLRLGVNPIGEAGARALASWPSLSGVTFLNLQNTQIRTAGAAALLASPHLGALEELWLQHSHLGDAVLAAIAQNPCLERLKILHLSGNPLTDAGVQHLVGSRSLGALEWLTLDGGRITAAAADALRSALPALSKIYLK